MASYWAKLLCSPPNEPGKLATLAHLRKRIQRTGLRRSERHAGAVQLPKWVRKRAKQAVDFSTPGPYNRLPLQNLPPLPSTDAAVR